MASDWTGKRSTLTLVTTATAHWMSVADAAGDLAKGRKVSKQQKAQAADWIDACKALASRIEKA